MISIRRELVAGATTFLTMSYVVVVNPSILATEETGLSFGAVMTATVVVSALASVMMGLVARLPYALAPGMGLNAYFTYSLVLGEGLTGPQALGAVVLSGLVFVTLSLTAARAALARAFPVVLQRAAAAGIGLFLAFLGLKSAGVVVAHPVTLVAPGPLTSSLGLFAAGLAATALLVRRRVPGALLLGIAGVTAFAAALGEVEAPARLVAAPDFSLVFAFEMDGLLRAGLVAPILTLLVTDLFDSLSTFLGVARSAGLVDERGEPLRLRRAMTVDAFATLASGLLGTSPATTYVESAAGIREGGRGGLTAAAAGLLFLPLLFLAPLAALVPPVATAPALVVVGVFMFGAVREISTDELLDAIPAFLTMALIPLTFSITQGIVWGVLAYVALRTATGRTREIPLALWVVAALCTFVVAAG